MTQEEFTNYATACMKLAVAIWAVGNTALKIRRYKMEGEIVTGPIGPHAKYDVKFDQGKLVIETVYDGAMADVGVVLKVDAESVLTALKAAIPGAIDDAIIDGAIALLKK